MSNEFFASPKQIVKYAGYDPKAYSAGAKLKKGNYTA